MGACEDDNNVRGKCDKILYFYNHKRNSRGGTVSAGGVPLDTYATSS